MKKLTAKQISESFVLAMATVFLLSFGPRGYENICEIKWAVFCVLTGLFAVFLFAFCVRYRHISQFRPTLPEACMITYFLLTLLSAFCSPWRMTALFGGGRYDGAVTALIYVFIALALSRTAKPGKILLRVFAAALTAYCAVCFLQLADLDPLGLYPEGLRWSGRETAYNGSFLGFTGNADLSAAVLCMGFCACLGGALAVKEWWLLLPTACSAVALLLSGMRGGILGAAGGMLLTLPGTLRMGKRGRRIYWCVLAVLTVILLLLFRLVSLPGTFGELHELLNGRISDEFGSGRIYIWKNVLPLVKERPLLGSGADTLGLRAGLAFTKTQADGSILRRSIDCAHCEYLNVAVNQGLPALLCLLLGAGASLFRSRKGTPAAAILRAALLAYAVQALTGITMPASTAFFWLCWGLLEAENRSYRENKPRRS